MSVDFAKTQRYQLIILKHLKQNPYDVTVTCISLQLKWRLNAENRYYWLLINICQCCIIIRSKLFSFFFLLWINPGCWELIIKRGRLNASGKSLIEFHFIPYNIPSGAPWLTIDHVFLCVPPIDVCQRPQATETFVLSKEALLSNVFPEDVKVTLVCAHGYMRISGAGTTVCSNGQWSEPDLICESKSPTAINNSDYFLFTWLYCCQLVMWSFNPREGLWTAKTQAEYEVQYQQGHSVWCISQSVLWWRVSINNKRRNIFPTSLK